MEQSNSIRNQQLLNNDKKTLKILIGFEIGLPILFIILVIGIYQLGKKGNEKGHTVNILGWLMMFTLVGFIITTIISIKTAINIKQGKKCVQKGLIFFLQLTSF